jgi:alkanesulfonate monooxygenase SsuD/methylene tetrahydromethanopterin reductase-like flavin-dependent oxidoreductase (luciferase family)
MPRIGIALLRSLMGQTPSKELVELSQLAEAQGFDTVVFPESVTDAMACAEAVALGTTRITVGPCLTQVWWRYPALTAATAMTLADLSHGRLLLGLGGSQRPLMDALEGQREAPRPYLRAYVGHVQHAMTGHLPGLSTPPVPLYLATVALQTAELGGEIADGLLLVCASRARLTRVRQAIIRGTAKAGKDPQTIDIALALPTFLSDDIGAARDAARVCLLEYAALPCYHRLLRNSGFVDEADGVREALARGDSRRAACLSDRLLEALVLLGPAARCREHLAAFGEAGVTLPLVMPYPIDEDYGSAVRRALDAFAPR